MMLLLGAGPGDGEKDASETGRTIDDENNGNQMEWKTEAGKEARRENERKIDEIKKQQADGDYRKIEAERKETRKETTTNERNIDVEEEAGKDTNEIQVENEEETNRNERKTDQYDENMQKMVGKVMDQNERNTDVEKESRKDADGIQTDFEDETIVNEKADDQDGENIQKIDEKVKGRNERNIDTEKNVKEDGERIQKKEDEQVKDCTKQDSIIEMENSRSYSNDSNTDEHNVSTTQTAAQHVKTKDRTILPTRLKDEENILNDDHKPNGTTAVDIEDIVISSETDENKNKHEQRLSMQKCEESHQETCVQVSAEISDENNINFDIKNNSIEETKQIVPESTVVEMNGTTMHQDIDEKDKNGSIKRKPVENTKKSVIFSNCRPSSTKKDHKMDQGWAWMVLLGAGLNHILADGLLASLGVFLVIWQDQFPSSMSQLSFILSLSLGIAYIAGK